MQCMSWTEDVVNSKLKELMDSSFEAVWKIAKENNATLRMGAYLIAIQRVVEASKLRGRN